MGDVGYNPLNPLQWRKMDPISGDAEAYSQLIISNTQIFQFPK
jgi:hypothetical protein